MEYNIPSANMDISISMVLYTLAAGLTSFLVIRWLLDPLRKIPGPKGLPFFGNALMIDPIYTHIQLYELAKQYGPVMKFTIFHKPFVVLNTLDAVLDAKLNRGDDFLGRAHIPRLHAIIGKDFILMDADDPLFPKLRHVISTGIQSHGSRSAEIETMIQDVLQENVEDLISTSGQTISSHQLCTRFVCCILLSLLYGQRNSVDDEIYRSHRELNKRLLKVSHPVHGHPILDIFPIFFNLMPLFFSETHKVIEEAKGLIRSLITKHVTEAKKTYDESDLRGCLDHLIKAQREEVDSEGNPMISDELLSSLVVDFFGAGMETSFASLGHALLDFVHDKPLVKQIQAQIDANFEPEQLIKYSDRLKLPQLEAYVHENLRILSQSSVLVPSCTLRDTEVNGYKIPKGTDVLLNAFTIAHNSEVYPEPFRCKPDRFLDDKGDIVPASHPVRRNFVGFGIGARKCPGESMARKRIFLFLANILQKFDVEAVGEIPTRDVRKYEMGIIVQPPSVDVRFTLRQCV